MKNNIVEIEEAFKLKNTVFIDVRSPEEYIDNRIIGAVSIPLFDDYERKIVGTLYKNEGKENAIERGLEFVSAKLKDFYKEFCDVAMQHENIVVYCARGGMRSRSVVDLMNSVGIKAKQLKGGYKAYRNYVMDYFADLKSDSRFIVLHGLTGVGKTEILDELSDKGFSVLDLEGLAKNCGSVFGHICYEEDPPSQKLFESLIFDKLYNSNDKHIFVESESKRVGSVIVPQSIYEMIVSDDSAHILVEASEQTRIERLVNQYVSLSLKDDTKLLECISYLKKRLSKEKIALLSQCVEEKDYDAVAKELIIEYYDPLYKYSIEKYKYDCKVDSDDMEELMECIGEYVEHLKGACNE
ncbi:tRNA 2-selenouridine synthase [Peptoclostridium litorale DSM 5388]|uniref:tRNA 2-selenouridine synthase SelU n=1 Tax=Peptoclostridium litorale DSM 5388 TaxID=1121324 RepID=A0A069RGC6_PEPLI|nr:tRNA 2-selenouridine(34) synthase MnmH [Peptoclostridium litorale]KDR95215.1 tRNA 2-selenouridine synthase SelU [Peptoclostridium litorale DSM 5388]SIN73282.1 tRNA 2-selenouridine synthase [Peptoclostridium litorale DSM 5388]